MVVSELELWEVDSNISGCFNLSCRSASNLRPHYNIILKQRDLDTQGKVKASATFVLHETASEDSSRQAFEEVRSTLEPMVNDGSVMMTRQLLEGIITPRPTEPSRLVFQLVEIMNKHVSILTHDHILQECSIEMYTVFPRSDAAATIYFTARFSAATIRGRPLIEGGVY